MTIAVGDRGRGVSCVLRLTPSAVLVKKQWYCVPQNLPNVSQIFNAQTTSDHVVFWHAVLPPYFTGSQPSGKGTRSALWISFLLPPIHVAKPPSCPYMKNLKPRIKVVLLSDASQYRRAKHTPMIAFSSWTVICLARSTAAATCCWCYNHASDTTQRHFIRLSPIAKQCMFMFGCPDISVMIEKRKFLQKLALSNSVCLDCMSRVCVIYIYHVYVSIIYCLTTWTVGI